MASAEEVYRSTATPEEIGEVLAKRLTATVGTLNDDGSIHLAYVIFLYENGLFYCETSSLTRKARNVRARSTASFIVEGGASSGRTIMAENEGAARLVEGAEAREVNHRIRAKYIVQDVLDQVNRVWDEFDDVAIEITAGPRWRSWCGATFAEATAAAVGRSPHGVWLPDD
jgi:nitroimidazol reductase NimA-like FMN-containing flavoprotein (pyridoxamine 5'-phosphate oxidase superfamily)